jgi:hypothetical protein
MLVQSIVPLIEAAAADPALKNLSGNILDPERLRDSAVLGSFDSSHDGIYAFFAFHPGLDETVKEYLVSGAVASDSGRHILALFAVNELVYSPRPLNREWFDGLVEIISDENVLFEVTRDLLGAREEVVFPGVLLVERLAVPVESVFVTFSQLKDKEPLPVFLRRVFVIAEAAYHKSRGSTDKSFADCVSLGLAKEDIAYVRSGRTSVSEWLFKTLHLLRKFRADIVAAVGLIT